MGKIKRVLLIIFIISLAHGCATTPDDAYERDSYGYTRYSVASRLRHEDVPVPSNFSLVPSKSLAVENQSVRISSMHYKGRANRIGVINFYKENMEEHGWELINLIEGVQTVINYTNDQEICTVIMTGTGNDITLTISLSPVDQ